MHFYRNAGRDEYMKDEDPVDEDKAEPEMELQNPALGPESGMFTAFISLFEQNS
jgi:hypothetical protein